MNTKTFFQGFTVLSLCLVWGVFTYNNGTLAVLKTAYTGEFPIDNKNQEIGTELQTTHERFVEPLYTDNEPAELRSTFVYIPGLDFLIKLLVARLAPAFTWSNPALSWFFLDFTASTQVISLIIAVESSRNYKSRVISNRPYIWTTLTHYLSAATTLPFWFQHHLTAISTATPNTPGFFDIPFNQAISLLPAHILCSLVPWYLSWEYTTHLQIAWWLAAGITMFVMQNVLAWFIHTRHTRRDSQTIIKLCYYYIFLVAMGVHGYTVYSIYHLPDLSFREVFLPGIHASGYGEALLRFLQWEMLLTFVPAFVWAQKTAEVRRGHPVSDVGMGDLGSLVWRVMLAVVVSPGAVLALLMLRREKRLFWV